jgi:hypothetical protein
VLLIERTRASLYSLDGAAVVNGYRIAKDANGEPTWEPE